MLWEMVSKESVKDVELEIIFCVVLLAHLCLSEREIASLVALDSSQSFKISHSFKSQLQKHSVFQLVLSSFKSFFDLIFLSDINLPSGFVLYSVQ
mgnify:CR=1 FL=1